MECRHLDDLYELYLLGALGVSERSEIHEHLRADCPYCTERLRQAALTVYFLALPDRKVRVPQPLKVQVLRRLIKK